VAEPSVGAASSVLAGALASFFFFLIFFFSFFVSTGAASSVVPVVVAVSVAAGAAALSVAKAGAATKPNVVKQRTTSLEMELRITFPLFFLYKKLKKYYDWV
jgi:hypothetical protein